MTLRYVQGVFVKDYDPTIEDAYRKTMMLDDRNCVLDILDTAGQEDYTVSQREQTSESMDGGSCSSASYTLVFLLFLYFSPPLTHSHTGPSQYLDARA